jgi:hypothetical protein
MSTIDPRSMALAGVVKVDARRAGGSVKTLAVKGEHRVLVQAAGQGSASLKVGVMAARIARVGGSALQRPAIVFSIGA